MTRVDVCVPCYNYGRFLRPCVDSLLTQRDVDVRVLIVDDASTDDSAAVGMEIAAADARVEFRRHGSRRGHIATYNEGIEWARARYYLTFQADDALTPGALTRAAAIMDARRDVGMTLGRQISFTSPLPPAEPVDEAQLRPEWRVLSGSQFIESCLATIYNQISMPTVVVRTAAQKAIGGYRETLPHSGDLEMWLRFAARGYSIAQTNAAQAFRRRHAHAMHLEYAVLRDLQHLLAAYETVFVEQGLWLGDGKALVRRARAGIADAAFWRASEAFETGDSAGCQRLLDYAAELAPSIRASRQWARLSWKRRIGPSAWRAVRPMVDHLKSRFDGSEDGRAAY
jgi:glycosyltransferase involved in cell wall biosynthesis